MKSQLSGDDSRIYWLLESGELTLSRIHGRICQMGSKLSRAATLAVIRRLTERGLLLARAHPLGGMLDPFYAIVKPEED